MHIGKEGSYIWCESNPYCIKTELPAQPLSFPHFLQCAANPSAQRTHVQNIFGEIPQKVCFSWFWLSPLLISTSSLLVYDGRCLLSLYPQYSTSEREREREGGRVGGCIDPSFFSPVSQELRSWTKGGFGRLLLSGFMVVLWREGLHFREMVLSL